jgi:hypothetical protein
MEHKNILYYPIPDYENYMISKNGRVLSLQYGGNAQKNTRRMKGLPPMKLLSDSGFGCGGTGYVKLCKNGKQTIHKVEDLMNISLNTI